MNWNGVYRDVCGINNLSWAFQEHIIKEALAYKPREGDLFVVSYPKCGTTWTQHIVYAIFNDGMSPKDMEEFMRRSPFMEMIGAGAAESMPRPGAIKTHLPFSHQPYSPQAKYIYVSRNPYDCCVSYYYHCKSFAMYQFADQPFDKFFDLFVEGKVEFGDYFDHQISWYDHRNDDNVLFVTYEELKKEPCAGILKIADFLGEKYGRKLREQPQTLEGVLNASSMKTMKGFNEEFKKWGTKTAEILQATGKYQPPAIESAELFTAPMTGEFVRKGIIGDWKNHFTSDQIMRMKSRIALKTKESTLMSLWKDIGLP
ncbi:sulfotransferase ssu-1-like isoform X2 [Dermacentor andersoni]|nr:sulfotransferase ssu-1-like isoform X2 [Dermacentor andersoni]XP_054928337.1 sulfotransferase ssu-1-like isoform X2 [Dermacentor andersoni]